MEQQNDINMKMREILMDWGIDVHKKFQLNEETLFKTVFIIDKFLERTIINRN